MADEGDKIEATPATTPEALITDTQQEVIEQPEQAQLEPVPAVPIDPPAEQTAQLGSNEPFVPVVVQTPINPILALLAKAKEAIQDRKRKKLDKIMSLFEKKPNITNDEVEKLLHVSDATATRYLSALEKEGRIKQIGKTGRGISYSKI